MSVIECPAVPRLVGRSSSHFTRLVRLFAHECQVEYELRVVTDLLATEPAAFGGHPGLKLPSLVTFGEVVFGSLNCSRALVRLATNAPRILWPEDVRSVVAANAQELTLQAMATEVSWLLTAASGASETSYATKLRTSLLGMMEWLEANATQACASLPPRDLSFFEAALFSLVEHLEFRGVLPLAPYPELRAFARAWGQRDSAIATAYRFD